MASLTSKIGLAVDHSVERAGLILRAAFPMSPDNPESVVLASAKLARFKAKLEATGEITNWSVAPGRVKVEALSTGTDNADIEPPVPARAEAPPSDEETGENLPEVQTGAAPAPEAVAGHKPARHGKAA